MKPNQEQDHQIKNTNPHKTNLGIVDDNNVAKKMPLSRKMRPFFILSPAFLLTVGILIPFVIAIYFSLTNYSFKYSEYSFVGLDNWIYMFTDSGFWHSAYVTFVYGFASTGVETVLGVLVALMLNRENIIARSLRIILIFPLVVAPVIATILWRVMTNSTTGVLSKWLDAIGIHNFNWGADPDSAMFTVVLIDVWVFTPFVILLVLAGLRSLPKAPYESALIDGGSAWFTFKNLTLPLIMPMLLIAILFRLMLSLQMFDFIFALTKGGPGDTLMTLSLNAYTQAFTYKDLGYSLPYMLILWVFVYILSYFLVQYWMKAQKKAAGK